MKQEKVQNFTEVIFLHLLRYSRVILSRKYENISNSFDNHLIFIFISISVIGINFFFLNLELIESLKN